MIREVGVLSALDIAQRDALGYLAIRLLITGWSFALLLFSGFCAAVGVLILLSRLIPRVIGELSLALWLAVKGVKHTDPAAS